MPLHLPFSVSVCLFDFSLSSSVQHFPHSSIKPFSPRFSLFCFCFSFSCRCHCCSSFWFPNCCQVVIHIETHLFTHSVFVPSSIRRIGNSIFWCHLLILMNFTTYRSQLALPCACRHAVTSNRPMHKLCRSQKSSVERLRVKKTFRVLSTR